MAARKKEWSGAVTRREEYHTPKGLFAKSASTIANTLEKQASSCAQAMSRLNFYINRAGKNLRNSDRKRLEAAKLILEHRCSVGR